MKGRAALPAACLLLVAGCSTTVIPPRAPSEPVTVFLLDHGRTPSLVLPTPGGDLTRYVYGDWNWYALRNTGLIDGVRALLWPTQATLGRRDLSGPPTEHVVRERIGTGGIEVLLSLTVSRADVERLRSRLDHEHRAGAQLAMVETLDLYFVPHPRRYSYLHNSNHAVAGWLKALGCEIRGSAFHSHWRIELPPAHLRDSAR